MLIPRRQPKKVNVGRGEGERRAGKVVRGQISKGNDLRFGVVFVCNVDILCSLAMGDLRGEKGESCCCYCVFQPRDVPDVPQQLIYSARIRTSLQVHDKLIKLMMSIRLKHLMNNNNSN